MEIFLACPPGLEPAVANEAASLGFDAVTQTPGGVTIEGGWQDVWRANLWSRTATRVLARIASFPVFHLAQLDKRSHRIPWSEVLRSDRPVLWM